MFDFLKKLVSEWNRNMEFEAMENHCMCMLMDGRSPEYVDEYYKMRIKEIFSESSQEVTE